MGDVLVNLWRDLVGLIPETALFLLVLIVGLIISWLVKLGLEKLLGAVKANSWFGRLRERTDAEGFRVNIVDIIPRVAYWLLVLLTLYLAFGAYGTDNAVVVLLASIINFLPKALVAVIIVVISWVLGDAAKDITREGLDNTRLGHNLGRLVKLFIVVIGIIAALAQVGIAVAVVLPLLYFLLFTLAVAVGVSFGIGGIPVARDFLEKAVDTTRAQADEKMPTKRAAAKKPAVKKEAKK